MIDRIFNSRSENWFESDLAFDRLYPVHIRYLSNKHWTPIQICQKAAEYLAVRPGVRILDIGSGVGKFCIAAAHFSPLAFFAGIEQRYDLVVQSDKIRTRLKSDRTVFNYGNFTEVDFSQFDGFYFYNSFYENLVGSEAVDQLIDPGYELYDYYCRHLNYKLSEMREGTRLVTYHSLEDEIPSSYVLEKTSSDLQLKFWRKVNH